MISARLAILAAMLAALALAGNGCADEARADKPARLTAQELSKRPALSGGTPRAWLTTRGDNADSLYCAARLKLPLATEPAWEFGYTPAEFSGHPARTVLHYDGLLVLAGDSPQLIGLDTVTGAQRFNHDVYEHLDSDAQEYFRNLYVHPQRLLVGVDNLRRFYAWDIRGAALERLWLTGQAKDAAGMVASGRLLVTGWDDKLFGLDMLDGSKQWQVPLGAGGGGVVLAGDGKAAWWSEAGLAMGFDPHDGGLMWNLQVVDQVDRIVPDKQRGLAYLAYSSEKLECRGLDSGKLLWSYSWRSLMDAEERARRLAETQEIIGGNNRRFVPAEIVVEVSEMAVTTAGLVLSLDSGTVLAFDHEGHIRWLYEADVPGISLLCFKNAILLGQLYARPQDFPYPLLPFWLDPPDWPHYQEVTRRWDGIEWPPGREGRGQEEPGSQADSRVTNEMEATGRQVLFFRFVALDPATGEELSAFEPARVPFSSPVPAYSYIVFSELPNYRTNLAPGAPSQRLTVAAYDWIDWEGE